MLWGHFKEKGEDWLTVLFMKVATKRMELKQPSSNKLTNETSQVLLGPGLHGHLEISEPFCKSLPGFHNSKLRWPMFVQKGWRRFSSFRLTILACPLPHSQRSITTLGEGIQRSHCYNHRKIGHWLKKKKATWYICIFLSYCNCFLPLFCLIVLKFLCTNFSVLPIQFSESSVHFPCMEVTNPRAPTSSRRGLFL